MASKPKSIAAPQMDIQGDIQKYVSGYSQALPQVLQFEQQYRPEFMGLNLGDITSFLQGVGGQQGLFGMAGQAAQATQQNLQAAREAELAGMTGQAGAVRGLAQALSPEAAAAVQAANLEAQRATQAARGLNFQEQRAAQQSAREAFGARGMLGSTGSVAAEILNREDMLARKRAEAAQAGANAYNLASQFYTAPGYATLGSAPLSYQSGLGLLSQGLQSIGTATPQLINPDVGVNLGTAQRQNVLQAQMANQQAKSAYGSGLMSLAGDVVKGAATAAAAFSDIRVKQNIKRVGATDSGLPIYTYQYKSNPSVTVMGVMAQDVQKAKPEAVITTDDGTLAVYYDLID